MTTAQPEHTAADAERALRALRRDPAEQAYGNYLRRLGLLPAVTPVPVLSPADEVATSEREVRAAMMQGFRS